MSFYLTPSEAEDGSDRSQSPFAPLLAADISGIGYRDGSEFVIQDIVLEILVVGFVLLTLILLSLSDC
jgi:hypothetical protein